MSSDFKYNLRFVVEEIFELGNTTKSRCLGVRVEAILGDPGAVRGGGEKSKRARKKFGRRKVK